MRHRLSILTRVLVCQAILLAAISPGITLFPTSPLSALASADGLSTDKIAASHDNNVEWNQLGHDSRDTMYRVPSGPVPTGSTVTLRLRAASGDLTEAQVRIYDDRNDAQSFLRMSLVADDGTYEWWQATVPSATLPTVYWYRFIAIDGTDADYYADDDQLLGGYGEPSEDEVDNSWQLTVYDPTFQTPEWVKSAIIYQVFVDRFSDGDPTNNTPVNTFYYNQHPSIYRSNTTNWNQVICDPRNPSGTCPDIYGQNFYGGDLQGIINQLDYLQSLGVTALYLNPIFKSPSNHGYDTTNYRTINASLGGELQFYNLVSAAADHNIVVILDGVFNHTSSDSIYFDRYSRYTSLGACENIDSPFRNWYTFTNVPEGTGACVSANGTPNSANYESWMGVDSLPLLNSADQDVQELFWDDSSPVVPIGILWVQNGGAEGWRLDVGGEIDPGVLTDTTNNYWEGFRSAVRAAKVETYIVGEEWGNAISWTLGSEWDASMNYQFSSAVLGFWRDEAFIDNDHNSDSPLGVLEPLMPSQIDERLHDLQERYPPEALAAMMNLIDSHDTNRALFMLDNNTDQNNASIYLNQDYDWTDALTRLRGVAILQMTLPGAPTIYYGDEVGLVGPVAYDTTNATWQDDPYNRQPFPWLTATGTPYYSFLRSQSNQDSLREYYRLLTGARNTHPALRTGSFDTLLIDDPNLIYAYGRRLLDPMDAAVVVLNRHDVNQAVTLNLAGYLPAGAVLADVLHGNTQYTVASDGSLSLPSVPTMSGMVLVLISGNLTLPPSPTDLIATGGENQVTLTWTPVTGAASYQVFRSLVTGGGYVQIGTSVTASYLDLAVDNGTLYYYTVKAVASNRLVSAFSNQAEAMPHWEIDWAALISPVDITHVISLDPTPAILGQVNISGVTSIAGATPGLIAQIGYGSGSEIPADWDWWVEAQFDSDQGDYDQFTGQLVPEYTGNFEFVYRFSTTHGRDWIYADLDGVFTGTPNHPGVLHVLPSEDITAPTTPQNLILSDWGKDFISLAWDPVLGDETLYAYDVYRSTNISQTGVHVARVLHPVAGYIDEDVTTGVTYYYRVQAIDSSFNRSGLSNQVTAIPQLKMVTVTFDVTVPAFTAGTVYIVGNQPELGNWDPSAIPMRKVTATNWTIDLTLTNGLYVEFKFTRGDPSWLNVEKAADGNTEVPNRQMVVDYGSTGLQNISSTVENWRDPIVVSFYPLADAIKIQPTTVITATWSQAMDEDTTFLVQDALLHTVAGDFTYNPATYTVTFTPENPLPSMVKYTVTVEGQYDEAGDPQIVRELWHFTVGSAKMYLPFIVR